MSDDTIFALATAPGRAGVAIVRLSGPGSLRVLSELSRDAPSARYMALRQLRDVDGVIDKALVVWFEAGASYTGEEMVELHIHGGRATIERCLGALSRMDDLRQAEPGEFTRRALINGVMDLAQTEGLIDLIDAETEAQRQQALSISEGALSSVVANIREAALHCLALMEASIDFADEEDAPQDVSDAVSSGLQRVARDLSELLSGSELAARVRDGFTIALIGPPNVGKSSLINALTKRETSIVSPFAGTTRDVVEAFVSLDGLPVTFLDTAGLRRTEDPVEKIGVDRAVGRAASADLRLIMKSSDTREMDFEFEARADDMTIWTKSDIGVGPADICVSVSDRKSIDELQSAVADRLRGGVLSSPLLARDRQAGHIRRAFAFIEEAQTETDVEVQAYLLRSALTEIGDVIEQPDTEDILGEIFSRFCIGK